MSTTRRRRWWPLLLFLAFVVMPLLEIYVVIQVGQVIGPWWTILLLVVDSVVGAWLIKREGRRAWAALRQALTEHRPPARELADGALILVGGTLLLAPGFALDTIGIVLILPFTRPLFRRLLTLYVGSRISVAVVGGAPTGPGGQPRQRPGPSAGESVVRGEVIDD